MIFYHVSDVTLLMKGNDPRCNLSLREEVFVIGLLGPIWDYL